MAIFDIEEVYKTGEPFNRNLKKLKQTVTQNDTEIDKISLENKTLRENKEKQESKIQIASPTIVLPNQKEATVDKSRQVDISVQKELLSYCTSFEDLEVFMPKKTDGDYKNILNALLFEYRKQFIEKSLELQSSNTNNKELLQLQLKKIEQLQKYIYDYMDEENEKELKDEIIKHPKISYLTTSTGNVCLLKDLKNIDTEIYPDFLEMFDSILNGKLRHPKTIAEKRFKNTFLQVRISSTRMLFYVLKDNNIVLSSAFVKKVQTSKNLSNFYKGRDDIFAKQKDSILNSIYDENYQKQQEEITKEVYKILRKKR